MESEYAKGYAKGTEDAIIRYVGDVTEEAINASKGKFSDLRKWDLAIKLAVSKIEQVRALGGNGRLEKIEVMNDDELNVKMTIQPKPSAEHIVFSISTAGPKEESENNAG